MRYKIKVSDALIWVESPGNGAVVSVGRLFNDVLSKVCAVEQRDPSTKMQAIKQVDQLYMFLNAIPPSNKNGEIKDLLLSALP